jgi:hypothetical protein
MLHLNKRLVDKRSAVVDERRTCFDVPVTSQVIPWDAASKPATTNRAVAEVLHDYGHKFIRTDAKLTLEYYWLAAIALGNTRGVQVGQRPQESCTQWNHIG